MRRGGGQARAALVALGVGGLLVGGLFGCGAVGPQDYGWFGDRGERNLTVAGDTLRVRWTKDLTAGLEDPFTPGHQGSPYTPVEHASAGLDPRRDRVFIGSSQGGFYAFSSSGRPLFRYDPQSGVEATPAVDEWGDVYLVAEDGVVHALRGRTGEVRWKEESPGPVRQAPVLTEDAVYVVTEDDQVAAFNRENGEILWTYEREVDVEYAIAGHAGLTLADGTLYTGFTDGTVVALDAADGTVVWERPTQLDYEPDGSDALRFYDVDTTPVVTEDTVYVASFLTGLYGLERSSGTVLWREPMTGVTAIAEAAERFLVVSSADDGLLVLGRDDRRVRWRRNVDRGAPGQPVVAGATVLVGESQGSLLALDVRSGREKARIDAGQGFSSAPAVAGRYGWILSNGGRLMAFEL
ncbi:MAG TPA: PQQ-binding-like beta-propeller repeat protein [Polyangiaceae bacterium LLY-WYZ-15_(1-7)]|nr:PQQ-binding-like beta-propeller repeat protein [Polyangiaceae bacterium LLY-WYZ-15_(1-7)]HJL06215.1 PQQ-binding-like beta-propeller repeat protein [Polyangiaceae bacterium LLY-WYZ-15_(1-7)]HJL10890.1 PQQ-binding-like beta-propeller repeat protein [Polyangiaceae bacterium LLY-WYZ-15_(1-7)]HJL21072.1 PQQ-binding-like beta-propeller repeat protein [Polyangiaceae bacterium LLY-WYZ-15_(1-7)]HJL47055.1 PQQ-binding-like beta-propeller repeat protein [Polyangiaceae bacterium LLY-WYZ-15_(1-7)]